MAALDFKDRSAVLAWLVASLPAADAGLLEALLDASAGNDCADPPVTTYRPFWVQANVLQSNPELAESLRDASGAAITYRDPASALRAIMRTQAAFDKALCVPEGFEAVLPGGVGSAPMRRVYE